MHAFKLKISRLVRRTGDRGASAVEYGLMVAAIAAIIVGVVFGLGHLVGSAFHKTCTALNAQPVGDGTPENCGDTPAAPVAP